MSDSFQNVWAYEDARLAGYGKKDPIIARKIQSAAEQIAEILRNDIFSGALLPGSKLRELEISKMLNVSRTPVREAFRILESNGLVEISPNKGVQICLITKKDVDEVCELRMLVEAHCIRKFITTLNEHHLQEMEEIVRRSEEALNQNDYSSYYTHSIAFHTYYLSKCQNQRLYSAFTRARNGMRCSQMILDKDPESCTGSINQHKEILQALRKGDPDKCERILRDHVFTNCQMMKRNLESHTRFQRSVGL